MVKINWTQFCDKYSPIKNTIESDTPCDGFLFLDIHQLKDVPLNNIWTLLHNVINDDMYITNGSKFINSLGYLVTRESWSKEETTEVRLEESDIKKDENEIN